MMEPRRFAPLRAATVPPAAKARDLEALRGAVVDAATVSGPLWVSYLGALFYLLVATRGVTHHDLLVETPVKLPVLGVDLPVTIFFLVGPLLFLVLHAYLLLHIAILADKIWAFDEELRSQIASRNTRMQLRRQLPINIFVLVLAGPRQIRLGAIGALLSLIIGVGLIVGPIILLIYFLLQFLPYQSEAILLVQRIVIVLDLALLWMLWPRVGGVDGQEIRQIIRQAVRAVLGLATAVIVVAVFLLATIPGEWLDEWGATIGFLQQPRAWLVAGEVEDASGRLSSVFSNRLVLLDFDALDRDKSKTIPGAAPTPYSISLKYRTLRHAVLSGANLRNANLDHAQMQGASLEKAQLQGASLAGAQLQGARLDGAQLPGASLDRASLSGASLVGANLEGASLQSAQLQGAIVNRAQLQGATLARAEMQGTWLVEAELAGATLEGAHLQGASLVRANLQGADLSRTFHWSSDLRHANTTATRICWANANQVDSNNQKWTATTYGELRASLEHGIPPGSQRQWALMVAKVLDPDDRPSEEAAMSEAWDVARAGFTMAKHAAAREAVLERIGCGAEGAPSVLSRIVSDPGVALWPSDARLRLARAFLGPSCAGALGMAEETRNKLTKWTSGPDTVVNSFEVECVAPLPAAVAPPPARAP